MKINKIIILFEYRLIKVVMLLSILLTYASCKKDSPSINTDEEEIVSPIKGTRTEFTLDSIFLYAKQIYLWNDVLPTYSSFSPREKYSNIKTEITAFKKELFDISQIKLNQETGRPFEVSNYSNTAKYSYLQMGNIKNGRVQAGPINGNGILANRIIHQNDKVIAYLALGSFQALSSSKLELNQVFEKLALEKPKYLVLDLRYNGGGYVETAEYVANLIGPSTLNGKIMYSEQFNKMLQNGNGIILSHQPYFNEKGEKVLYKGRMATLADVDYTEKGNTYKFDKKGKLESIQDIYVIVSGQTASASELLISCLKPYFNIKLIGERTYGKPVGFFGINIDQYTVYLSSFLIKNANGWSDYFDGMLPDLSVVGVTDPILGDPEEICFKSAISLISGDIKLADQKIAITPKINFNIQSSSVKSQNEIGMIESRFRLKN